MADDEKRPIIVIKKKKASGHGNHSHGAWKVAYADFVTAMMAFFMVMWLMGSDEEIKSIVAGYFNNPDISPINIGLSNPKAGKTVDIFDTLMKPGGRPVDLPVGKANTSMTEDNTLNAIHEELEQAFTLSLNKNLQQSSKTLEVSFDSNGLNIKLIVDNFFEAGKTDINPAFLPAIRRVGQILMKYPDQLVRIEGHADADEVLGKPPFFDWRLSTERAQKVLEEWSKYFLTIKLDRMQIAGASFYRPLKKHAMGEGINRRVEITILYDKQASAPKSNSLDYKPDKLPEKNNRKTPA